MLVASGSSLTRQHGAAAVKVLAGLLVLLAIVAVVQHMPSETGSASSPELQKLTGGVMETLRGIFKPRSGGKERDRPKGGAYSSGGERSGAAPSSGFNDIRNAVDQLAGREAAPHAEVAARPPSQSEQRLENEPAGIAKYTDRQNRTHYVDSFGKIPPEFQDSADRSPKLPKITRSGSGYGRTNPSGKALASNKRGGHPPVQVFVTSWCPYCRQLEAYLKTNRIPYSRFDIEKNKDGARKYEELGGGGVPVVKIGDEVVRGFRLDKIKQLLR